MAKRGDPEKQAKKEYEEVFRVVQGILTGHWNPLDIKATDAYAAYASQVVFLAKTGASAADISGHLAHLEKAQMGLPRAGPGRRSRCEKSGRLVAEYFRERK